jgi:hypothetical protein
MERWIWQIISSKQEATKKFFNKVNANNIEKECPKMMQPVHDAW